MAIWQPRGFPVLQKLTDGILSFPEDRYDGQWHCCFVPGLVQYLATPRMTGMLDIVFSSQKEFV